jgi:dolichyl-phosphate beta-glucosyltransferase
MKPLSSVAGPAWLEIIVPARNEEARLPEGLSRLCAKAAELPIAIEIVVVDNASTDGTADIVLNWPQGPVPVRLIRAAQPRTLAIATLIWQPTYRPLTL